MSGIGALGLRFRGKRDRTGAYQEVKSIEPGWTAYFEPSIAICGDQVAVIHFDLIGVGRACSRKQNGGRSRGALVDN
jgi:hypothetical protein